MLSDEEADNKDFQEDEDSIYAVRTLCQCTQVSLCMCFCKSLRKSHDSVGNLDGCEIGPKMF